MLKLGGIEYMKLEINIDLSDSDMELHAKKFELNKILDEIATKVYYSTSRVEKIRDSNGDIVGSFRLTKN
jgi:hypothetical protein